MGIGCLGKIEKLELQFFRIGSRFQMSCMECEYDPFRMSRMMFYIWLLNHIPAAGKHTSLRCESDPIKSECNNFRFCMDFQNLGSRASPEKDWLKVQGMRIVMKTARSRIVEGVDFQ